MGEKSVGVGRNIQEDVMLKIAPGFSLPVDTVTQAMGLLAKRRAGKSYTMRRLAEELILAKQQVILVDPKGDQWGIKFSADGKGPGLPLVLLGGERGDVPLEVGSGEMVARLAVEERVSMVLDLSLFRKHEVATFMTAFLENLYRLKAKEVYRTPVMLIIDEADAIAPQRPQKGEERMLGAAEDIVRRGGQRGIGCILVTQRAAVLNKNVLTQVQILVALRTIAPQDLAAMNAWIEVHGTVEQKHTLMESLPSLPVGDAWFWSPGWPDVDGIFKRVHVLPIRTFDSGKTPEPGEKRIEPKNAADIDMNALRRQMAATIERAKDNDPVLLKKRIRELEKGKPKQLDEAEISKVMERAKQEAHREYASRIKALKATVQKQQMVMKQAAERLVGIAIDVPKPSAPPIVPVTRAPVPPRIPARTVDLIDMVVNDDGGVNTQEQRVLDMIATLNNRDIGADQASIARWLGLHPRGGRFTGTLASLRAKGLLVGCVLTAEGNARARADETGIEKTKEALQKGHTRKVLDAIVQSVGPLTQEELAERLGIHPRGGRFTGDLAWLRQMKVIPERGPISVTEGALA